MQEGEHQQHYSDSGFWEKLGSYALVAGREVVTTALKLYYTYQDKNCPVWAKGIIVASLGYFIMPIDAIPDVTPAVGYADDLGALAIATSAVAAHITDEAIAKANETLRRWFGSNA